MRDLLFWLNLDSGLGSVSPASKGKTMEPDLTSDVSAAEKIASSLEAVKLETWSPMYHPKTARLLVLNEATALANALRQAVHELRDVIGAQAGNLRQIATTLVDADAQLAGSLER